MSEATPSTNGLPSKRVIAVRFLLSLLPLVVFVWILRKVELPLLPNAEALHRVSVLGVVGYTGWFLVALVVRGIRWRYLINSLTPMSLRTAFDITSIGNAAIVLLPMRSGEFVRPLLAKRRGISSVAALSTIGAERIIDGLAVGLIVFVSLSLAPGHPQGLEILPLQFRDPSLVTRAARFALIGFSLALVALLVFYFHQAVMQRVIQASLGRLSPRLADNLNVLLGRLASGLSFLKDHRAAATYLGLTVLYWTMQLVGIHLLMWVCGFEHVRFIETCAVTGVFALGFLLPSPPGFFGAFQTTFYAGLLLYFPTVQVINAGACVVFFTYLVQIGLTLLLGLFCYLREFTWGGPAVGEPRA